MKIEENDKTKNECIICFDSIENQEMVVFTKCEHNNNYHQSCVNNWITQCNSQKITPTCPVCREITIYIPNETETIITPQNFQIINNNIMSSYKCIHIIGSVTVIILLTTIISISNKIHSKE